MKHENRYVMFDFNRGISALLVCAGCYLLADIFKTYAESTGPNISIIMQLFYSFFHFLSLLGGLIFTGAFFLYCFEKHSNKFKVLLIDVFKKKYRLNNHV
jgi:hypothetical protein